MHGLRKECKRIVIDLVTERIDACAAQFIDRCLTAAFCQECPVRSRVSLQDLFGKRDGGRHAQRVFVHIEVVVEMRHIIEAVLLQVIHDDRIAEILPVKLQTAVSDRLGGDGTALLDPLMKIFFKLGKHRLPITGADKLFHQIAQDVTAISLVGAGIQQITVQQDLIDRRSDLRDEDLIIGH